MELSGTALALYLLVIGQLSNIHGIGHSGEAFTVRFDPTAQHIASGSMDRSIRMSNLWTSQRGLVNTNA